MKNVRKPAVPNTRRNMKNPLEGVTKGWPSHEFLRHEPIHLQREPLPYIVLEGAWLRDCGFEVGRHYRVRPGDSSVVIEAVA